MPDINIFHFGRSAQRHILGGFVKHFPVMNRVRFVKCFSLRTMACDSKPEIEIFVDFIFHYFDGLTVFVFQKSEIITNGFINNKRLSIQPFVSSFLVFVVFKRSHWNSFRQHHFLGFGILWIGFTFIKHQLRVGLHVSSVVILIYTFACFVCERDVEFRVNAKFIFSISTVGLSSFPSTADLYKSNSSSPPSFARLHLYNSSLLPSQRQ